jgi:alpha-glucosidase (family GH31 glycosyl hydrolase)
MNRRINLSLTIIFACFTACLSATGWQWSEVAPGVWKSVVGTPEAYDLLQAAGVKPSTEALARLGSTRFPLNVDLTAAGVKEGQTYLRFPLERNEQIYGFGLNFKTIHQRGRVLELHVDHYGGKDDGRTHAPVPFYVSAHGYGVFVNSARYIRVWSGTGVRKDSPDFPRPLDRNTDRDWTARPYSDAVEMLVPAAGVEIYLFGGPKPLDAVRRYNLYTGGGCLPPRWGLGFSHRVPRLHDENQVLDEVREFAERGFPLDVIGLEPGWQSKSYPCTFVWDQTRFPAPARFVEKMKSLGIRVNLWTNPYVSPESPLYDALLPLSSSHTVWLGIVPDFTLPKAVEILVRWFKKEHVEIGVSGYKIDETDGYDHYLWPDVATFPSGLSAEQIRQTYGVLLQKATAGIYSERNQRTYGLTRASNAGAGSFPYVIYNDYYSHEDFITALCNSGFSGLLWTPEVRSSQTGEEWLRRMQSVCFSPMAMLNAWASGTKPWSFPEVERAVKEIALLRMRLMPYFYTEFARYRFDGIPPFRAMALEEAFAAGTHEETKETSLEQNPYEEAVLKEVKDQYMAGEYLLVAPMYKGQISRQVVLPKGKWYDFYTGTYAGGGQLITVTPGLETIPLFAKDGAVIPMMRPALRAPASGQKFDLEIRHYGLKESVYGLYDDDGETLDYERGMLSWRELRVTRNPNGELIGTVSRAEPGKPDNLATITWRFMTR